MLHYFAHSFGKRYELPLPLWLFILSGALAVVASVIIVWKRRRQPKKPTQSKVQATISKPELEILSYLVLLGLILAGYTGSQEIAENILPTFFWIIAWIVVPLLCGIKGDFTKQLNAFGQIARRADSERLRLIVLKRKTPFKWPSGLGFWPVVTLYFALASSELINNNWATKPRVIAVSLAGYFIVSKLGGLFYGEAWLKKGEVFSVLYRTWGRLGYWRFGNSGVKGFMGGLRQPFEAGLSSTLFVLLLLTSVSFDALLATPLWSRWQLQLPEGVKPGTTNFKLSLTIAFAGLTLLVWLIFNAFARASAKMAGRQGSGLLPGLLISLLPISFGYLLAHNLQYILINTQLLFPLLGNPTGSENWPIHLRSPFNDSYKVNASLLPSSFYWYAAIAAIVLVHIAAVFLANWFFNIIFKDKQQARRAEYPWITVMVLYTIFSLWLLAQPLVKEAGQNEPEAVVSSGSAVAAP